MGGAKSARSNGKSVPDKEIESSSDDEIIDTSDMTSQNQDELAEQMAEQYAEMVYNKKRDEEDINYDHYQFSVSQKYDLTTRRLKPKRVVWSLVLREERVYKVGFIIAHKYYMN